jgi:hypothetical protein
VIDGLDLERGVLDAEAVAEQNLHVMQHVLDGRPPAST